MSKIMVNPTLYITCRLCLEDLGVYQIVPEVREQIKFCFDIDVRQFDGLPQLICNKCEKILNLHFETKKKFVAKQAELKTRISGVNTVPNIPRESVVINTVENNIKPPSEKVIAPSAVVLPSVVLVPKVDLPLVRLPSVTPPSVISSSWSKEYKKRFYCKFCNASYSAKKYLLVHLTKHKRLKAKFTTVFNKHCQVKLEKIDGKTNFTGSNDKVVYDTNKVIESRVGDHYIVYSNNKDRASSSSVNNKTYNYMDNIQYDSSDSHSEEIIRKERSAKRRRIYSNSSTDTVVLDEGSSGVPKAERASDLDEDTWKSTNKKGNVANNIQNDGTINKIIELCCSKYVLSQTQEHKNSPETTGLQLKRKFLSIGRKIINTKDFNSTALLRFLKYKNVNINWIQNRGMMDNNNFVKIMTKMENDKKDTDSKNEAGWQDHTPTQKDTLFTYEQLCNGCSNYEPSTADSIIENNIHVHNEINVIESSDSAVLSSLLLNDTKKLLNANPVANPKQLPKKNDKPTSDKVITKAPYVPETENCMPIITSTTSLLETEAAPEPPRIKVKPASELLSKESMNRLKDASKTTPSPKQNEVVVTEVPNNIYIIPSMPMAMPGVSVNINTFSNNSIVSANNSMIGLNRSNDTMVLDTAELPNTRTDSPFYYLRNLLKIHNIILLNTDAVLSDQFNCLIKFKVCYKQEAKDRPVILCLSLYCHKNVFCLKVKDRHSEDIDYPKISANWQWEILRIYTGDVVNKILNHAMKISQETYEYTNNFLCLLKSIKCTM